MLKTSRPPEEEEMVYICEPEIGDILGEENDQRSLRDLIDCQEGSGRFPNGQMGKGTEMRSADDLKTARRAEKKKFQIAKRAMS
jgi:hypothetical protein